MPEMMVSALLIFTVGLVLSFLRRWLTFKSTESADGEVCRVEDIPIVSIDEDVTLFSGDATSLSVCP